MMTTATKTKRTLLRSESIAPPREIREKTKERREWLSAKLTEINARPNREAKIVGTGSYQSISVYEVKEVEGRLRYRGICQYCGNSQVVDGGVLVLHGYKRPGDGAVYGRCPGMDLQPLNVDKAYTEKWLAEAITAHETAQRLLRLAEEARDSARTALYATNETNESYKSRPLKPTHRSVTEQELGQYKQRWQQWAERFPLTAAYDEACKKVELARQQEWIADSGRRHFQSLIDSKVYGTELKQEVIA